MRIISTKSYILHGFGTGTVLKPSPLLSRKIRMTVLEPTFCMELARLSTTGAVGLGGGSTFLGGSGLGGFRTLTAKFNPSGGGFFSATKL